MLDRRLNLLETGESRKSRGAFFTPPEISEFVAQWAVRDVSDLVLEPSCGEAAFLLPVGKRLQSLGATVGRDQLRGIEIHDGSARRAEGLLMENGLSNHVTVGDFFDFSPTHMFDAVVGNPPYVRYQTFTGTARAKAQTAALAQGVRLTGLASSWASFVVHASTLLQPQGRLGLVLPAELLSVNYAGAIRRFLMQRFANVRIVLFEALVFPGVLEEVVLLLAEGEGPTDRVELFQVRDLAQLRDSATRIWIPADSEAKWIQALLPPDASDTYSEISTGTGFAPLITWGKTNLGMVTGNNNYFTMTRKRARELGLRTKDLLRISPPSSRHLRGLNFTEQAWLRMAANGSRVYLFRPTRNSLSKAASEYIAEGETLGIQEAYKCRVRSPWWKVPLVSVPDLFLTYMNHDTPRLVANRARMPYLNSVHGVNLKPGVRQVGTDLLPIGLLNSLTLLGAELVGRSYGGGILKLEPKEADSLPVPSSSTLLKCADALRALRPQIAKHLDAGELLEAVRKVDQVLLAGQLRLRGDRIRALRLGREVLFGRRVARGERAV